MFPSIDYDSCKLTSATFHHSVLIAGPKFVRNDIKVKESKNERSEIKRPKRFASNASCEGPGAYYGLLEGLNDVVENN